MKKFDLKNLNNQISFKPNLKSMNFSLVIDSEFLDFALSAEISRRLLSSLLLVSDSVCFYGLNPDQKRSLVKLLKKNFAHNPTVMAVGNVKCDLGMLEEADISVVIEKGKEKNHYFNTSITVPKFSDLKRLILVDGHYSYVRLSKILHYSLFKGSMICMLVLMNQSKAAWSGITVIDYSYFILFELAITLLPILTVGVFEKDCDGSVCKQSREAYLTGVFDSMMSMKSLIFYLSFGGFQGILIYSICTSCFSGSINSKGFTEDSELQSTLYFLVTSLSLILKTLISTRKFYFPTIISPFLSFFFLILLIFYYSKDFNEIISNQGIFWIIGLTVPLFVTIEYIFLILLQKKIFSSPFNDRKEMYENKLNDLYQETDDWNNDKSEILEINKKSLKFNSQSQEKKYQDQLANDSKYSIKIIIGVISFACFLYLILVYTNAIGYLAYRDYGTIPAGLTVPFLISAFIKQIPRYKLFFMLNVFLVFSLIVYSSVNLRQTVSYYACIQVLFSVFIIFKWKYTLIQVALTYCAALYTIAYQGTVLKAPDMINVSLLSFVLISGISSLCLIISYCIDLNKRQEYHSIENSENQFKKSSQILSYLLPEFVKKRVNDGIRYIAEEKGVVSVVFCDICDFDKIIESCEEKEIISILDDLFSRFDSICDTIGVSKIETVGKTYMACAGLKDFDSDLLSDIYEVSHARRAIELAFAILEECQKTFISNGEIIKMKIGIHSGPVIAGVVGFHKPQFSLVGDTVNTASRMASTLTSSNQIQISRETYNLLDDMTDLHFRNNYPEVKGKGTLHTLIVEHILIKRIGSSEYEESIDMSSSAHRDSVHTEKFSRYTNLEKYSSSFSARTQNFSRTFTEKFRQVFCCETKEESALQRKMIEKYFELQQFGLIIFLVVNLFIIIIYAASFSSSDEHYPRLIVIIIQEGVAFGLILLLKRIKDFRIVLYLLFLIYLSGNVAFLIIGAFIEVNYSVDLMFFYFYFLLSNFCTGLQFTRNILWNVLQILVLVFKFAFFYPLIDHVFLSVFFIFCVMSSAYLRDKAVREDLMVKEMLVKEHEKTERLLTQMMPFNALKNLQEEITVTDKLSQVTFMYADIVGFTSWSSSRSPKEVINMLSQMFTKFDKLCVEHDIYKVYTIGDCYVAMGYRGDYKRNPAVECLNVVSFAFKMVQIIEEVNQSINAELNMRIGIHTGDAIGGITGTNVVRYDIYGKDVMIANKMESNGVPGKVAVSQATKDLLEENTNGSFGFEFLKDVKAWGETVKSYILIGN
jgi:class 3 adenylate cyclase